MIQFTENNWFTWQYGIDGPSNGCYEVGKNFRTNYTACRRPIGTFSEELLISAKSTIDTYTNKKLVLLFSGGADSEVALLTYLRLGHPIEVHIYRYENDYNLYDVSYALAICNSLNIPYKLIDFNLEKFLNTDAERLAELSEIDLPGALPHLKFLEVTDGVPIMVMGDQFWTREQDIDYSQRGDWYVIDREFPAGFGKFLTKINKEGIPYWLKWTPELTYSYTNLNWFKTLTSDGFIGKTGVKSTKILGYREAYPHMLNRTKKTGVEGAEHLINEFKCFLDKKNLGHQYNQFHKRSLAGFRKDLFPY